MNGMNLLQKRRFWPPRFGLVVLMLFVLAAAVVFAGFESWRRAQHARNARAEFERHNESWNLGVIRPEVIIEASQNLLAAERRQWFSSFFEPAIVDSSILRLTRIRDKWQLFLVNARLDSEEGRRADLQLVDDLTRLIDEAESQNLQASNETAEE
jgi:hypothetical protein